MEIAVLLFEGVTALDAVGPIEVLGRLPGAEVKLVAKERGALRAGASSSRMGLIADYRLAEVETPRILVVPGGLGTRKLVHDRELCQWIRDVHHQTEWTASVCTGALLLGAAGVLDGVEATTHWRVHDRLKEYGAKPRRRRVVVDGKIVTAAGVSAGIDMALHLAGLIAGEERASAIQLQLEYDPNPPFDCGHPSKASEEVLRLIDLP